MGRISNRSGSDRTGGGPLTDITAENYQKKASAYIEDKGGGFVLTPFVEFNSGNYVVMGPTHEEIAAWCTYYDHKGFKQDRKGRRPIPLSKNVISFMKQFGSWTVPSQWPWEFDAEYRFRPRSGDPLDDDKPQPWPRKVLIQDDHQPLRIKPARPETKASCDEWLRKAGVDHLSTEDLRRKKAIAEWGKWFVRQPSPASDFANMAPDDPNRRGTPEGWVRAGGKASGNFTGETGANFPYGIDPSQLESGRPRKPGEKWKFDPRKAFRHPMWWLLLDGSERAEIEAIGKAPKPARCDQVEGLSDEAIWGPPPTAEIAKLRGA